MCRSAILFVCKVLNVFLIFFGKPKAGYSSNHDGADQVFFLQSFECFPNFSKPKAECSSHPDSPHCNLSFHTNAVPLEAKVQALGAAIQNFGKVEGCVILHTSDG